MSFDQKDQKDQKDSSPEITAVAPEDPAVELPEGAIQIPSTNTVYGPAARVPEGVTFEEFHHYALEEREEEKRDNEVYLLQQGPWSIKNVIAGRFSAGWRKPQMVTEGIDADANTGAMGLAEKGHDTDGQGRTDTRAEMEAEWKTASRALKTTSWGSIFYLITTDILGWSGAPYVGHRTFPHFPCFFVIAMSLTPQGLYSFTYSSVGFGPGAALYTIFGVLAGMSGVMIWKVFLGLSSSRYPMSSFGDTYYRVYGKIPRHLINVWQSLQQFMSVAVLILGNATSLAQIIQGANRSICFIVCMVVCMILGMLAGTMRSLNHVGWLANGSVWMNIASFIMVMVASAKNPINYSAVTKSTLITTIEPVKWFAGAPPNQYQQQAHGFAGQLGGVNTLIYSYGGALLFVAFLSEMRHPMDFWKALLCAQTFICLVYMVFGMFVYGHYGQYSASTIGTVITPYGLQTANNVLGLLTGLIASCK